MGKRKRDKACGTGQAGFTLVELVITIIVLAIIAKIAGPAWLDMKSDSQQKAADLTRERLKAKWLAEKNSADRGAGDYPTLGRMVGHKAAVPPAPATIPVLLDYSYHLEPDWWGHMYTIDLNNTGSGGWNTVKYVPWSGQITCEGSKTMFLKTAWAPTPPSGNVLSNNWLVGYSASKVSGTPDSGASVGAPVPKCRASFSYVYNIWVTPTSNTMVPALPPEWVWWDEGSGWYAFYKNLPTEAGGNIITTPASRGIGISASGEVPDTPAYRWRITCKGGESTYGVPYVISGYGKGQDGKTVSSWDVIPGIANVYQLTPVSTGVPATYNADGIPPTVGAAVCQRVGGPTTGNAEYLGNPPLALDYSGWCLGSGTTMKLPAYKDEAGTVPTSAYGDTVKAIGGKAVSDPVNCPAS